MSKQFNMVQVCIGYNTYVMDKDAAMAIFNALSGGDVYKVDSDYDSTLKRSIFRAHIISPDEAPSLKSLGPVQFHMMLEAQKMRDEAEDAKLKASQ